MPRQLWPGLPAEEGVVQRALWIALQLACYWVLPTCSAFPCLYHSTLVSAVRLCVCLPKQPCLSFSLVAGPSHVRAG